MEFKIGEQPRWAGTEECEDVPASFMTDLLSETVVEQLITRGYAVVKVTATVQSLYGDFLESFEKFMEQREAEKTSYAMVQFEKDKHSPNQYHGYSLVGNLKEQYMLRLGGAGTSLTAPASFVEEASRLYVEMDQLCRKYEAEVVRSLGGPKQVLDQLLDPVGAYPPRYDIGDSIVTTDYLIPGYISSSLLDCFHYRGEADKDNVRFTSNHASHTDSGLLTCVVVTDSPALEIYDAKLGYWIALERVIHRHLYAGGDRYPSSHRQYATIFWGDSVAALNQPTLRPTLHRVAGQRGQERYSVVFKQRARCSAAPRYQEDYILAQIQLDVQQESEAASGWCVVA